MKKNFDSFDNLLKKVFNDKDLSEIYQYDLLIKKIRKIFDSEILFLPWITLKASANFSLKVSNIAKHPLILFNIISNSYQILLKILIKGSLIKFKKFIQSMPN